MKRTLLAALAAGATVCGSAQVTLTNATHGLSIGDVNILISADTTLMNNGGPTGTGQTWNYGSMQINSASTTINYVAPSSTPYGSSFPSATMATSDGSGMYGYYTTSSSALNLAGVANSQTTLPYSNSELISQYPFAYSNTVTDAFYSSYTSNSIPAIRSGNVTITADGAGTLILPSGSYPVLRVKVVQLFQDSIIGFYNAYYNFVSYYWYSASQKFPLLTYNVLTTTVFSTPNTARAVYVNSAVAGVGENFSPVSGVNLFPNPSSTQSQLDFTLAQPENVSIVVRDMTGRNVMEIQKGELDAGIYSETLDLSTLPKGIYFVSILAGDKISNSKLAVE